MSNKLNKLNKNYVSVRIERVKTATACKQAEHDTRTRPPSYLKTSEAIATTYSWVDDYEFVVKEDAKKILGKTDENEEKRKIVRKIVVQSAESQQERYKESVKQKPQKGGNWFIRGIITFSPEGFSDDPTERERSVKMMKERAKRLIERIAETHEVNPIYMSTHTDETTPHVHFLLEGSHRETGKSVSRIIKPKDCREMQDMAGIEFADMGFVRGVSRDVTGAKHKNVRESHRIEQEKLEKQSREARKRVKNLADAEQSFKYTLDDLDKQVSNKAQDLIDTEDKLKKALAKEKAAKGRIQEYAIKIDNAKERADRANDKADKAEDRAKRAETRLKVVEEKLKEYGDTEAIAMRCQQYEDYLEERGLKEDFEDWASAYQTALQEQDYDDEPDQSYSYGYQDYDYGGWER